MLIQYSLRDSLHFHLTQLASKGHKDFVLTQWHFQDLWLQFLSGEFSFCVSVYVHVFHISLYSHWLNKQIHSPIGKFT